MTAEALLARAYRLLFHYETADDDEAPAWLTTMGQEDCRREIRILEAEIASRPKSNLSH